MRPQYESAHDRQAELEIITEFCEVKNRGFAKLPKKYFLDWAILRNGRMSGFVETKDRPTLEHGQYDSLFIAADKVLHAQQLFRSSIFDGMHTLFVVRFADKRIGFVDLFDWDYVAMGGRGDRGDEDDREPMAHYYWTKVRLL